MKAVVLPLLVLVLLVAEQAQAAKLIAVLPLDVTNAKGKLDKEAQASIEEMLRDVATDALTAGGWTILSTQNQLQLLLDNGVDPTKCGEQNCQLATAREIKAEKFFSGAVQYGDGEFTASIRLIDTATGRILASERLSGKTAKALRVSFEAKANTFFQKAGLVTPSKRPTRRGSVGSQSSVIDNGSGSAVVPEVKPNGPRVRKSAVTAAVGTLTIAAKPKDAVRLDLVDPDGKKSSSGASYDNKQAKPGTWKVIAQATGYEEQTVEVEVPADDVAFQKIELKPLGTLMITGTPAGAAVSVSGPGGFKDDGGLPWEADGLRSGTYHVKVARDGYGAEEQTVEVKPGEPTTLRVKLEKGASGAGMVSIPGGTFWMGSSGSCRRQVTLSPYAMDRTEVTVAAYAACVKSGKCSAPSPTVESSGLSDADRAEDSAFCNWGKAGKENHPINCVDWNQAKAFCAAQRARLPTEAEWEYGAIGKYPSGDGHAERPRIRGWRGTAAVGTHPAGASPFGLQDMAGNLYEWVEYSYGSYPADDATNQRQESGQNRVGCRSETPQIDAYLRGTFLGSSDDHTFRTYYIGFRCARGAGH